MSETLTYEDGWQPISTAPMGGRESVLLIAPYPTVPCWSDPRVSWHDGRSWVRWPHAFEPTHWAPIPKLPALTSPSPAEEG